MAHCGPEEAAVVLASIAESNAYVAWDNAVIILMMANADLAMCEMEHGP